MEILSVLHNWLERDKPFGFVSFSIIVRVLDGVLSLLDYGNIWLNTQLIKK